MDSPDHIDFQWDWTPDSTAVLAKKGIQSTGGDELWRISLEGQPQKLNVDTRKWLEGGLIALHPNGTQWAYVATAGDPGAEVWALENFLPRHDESK